MWGKIHIDISYSLLVIYINLFVRKQGETKLSDNRKKQKLLQCRCNFQTYLLKINLFDMGKFYFAQIVVFLVNK